MLKMSTLTNTTNVIALCSKAESFLRNPKFSETQNYSA